jgi:TonB family protein
MDPLFVLNLASYSAQIALLVAIGALAPRMLRIRTPDVTYAYWRALLVAAILLPWLQPRHIVAEGNSLIVVMGPATAAAGETAAATRGAIDWPFVLGTVLICGIAIRVVWMAAGLLRLRRLRSIGSSASAFDVVQAGEAGLPRPGNGEVDELQSTLGTRADVRFVLGLGQPVTFGVMRPVVLLPAALRRESESARRAVIAHELLHVQRRDWLSLMAEELVLAAFWFHPAIWWLVGRARLAREEVVDELAVLACGSRRAYVKALMLFADPPAAAATVPFAVRQHLFSRVLLLTQHPTPSSRAVVVSGAALALVLLLALVAAPVAAPLIERPPAAQPDRPIAIEAPLSATPVATGLVAATAEAEAIRDGRLSRGEEPVRPLPQTIATTDASAAPQPHTPALTAADEPVAVPRPESPPEPATPEVEVARAPPSAPIRVGGMINSPARIRNVPPVYPPIAQSARVSGTVILEVVIGADGRVADAKILRSIPLLDQAALDAVRQWEFTPTMLNGGPVPIVMTVTVNFRLES